MKPITYLTGALAVAAVLSPPSAEATKPDAAKKTYTLFAGGDVNLGRWVPQKIFETGPKWALEAVRDLIAPADVAMVNVECVISSRGRFWDKGERRPFLYRAPPAMVDVLSEAGVDVAIASNNHSMDFGPDALLEEIEILEAAGIAPVGIGPDIERASRPVYVRVGDLIVAFIGLETEFPKFGATEDKPGVFHADLVEPALEALKRPIAEAREHADLVVFSPHWGDNWTERPAAELKEAAHAIVDLGVDAIIGHSAHHIHGVEVYKGKPILYDIGSFYFDTIGQGRLRYSAGYVLEFGVRGVTKVTMYPVILSPNRTEYADGASWEKIKGLLTSLTSELDPATPLAVEGKTLVLGVKPAGPAHPRKSDPERVHVSNTSRPLPDSIKSRKTEGIALATPPEWAAGFADVRLDDGVVVLGGRSADAVRPKLAFMAEVALRVPGRLQGNWIASIKGKARDGEGSFVWSHPIADGAWVPAVWEKGQVVVDRTLVRSALAEEGVYDLYWRLEAVGSKAHSRPVDAKQGDEDGFVRIGEIEVKKKGIPDGPAGVAWDGWLPKSKEFDAKKFQQALDADEVLSPLVIAGIAGGAALLLAAVIFIVVRVRRRARSR
jgi:poly-gamma-glutamate capsule biosynthesis protein CapA/YwtB (metallophosphatase superfamily)